MADFVPVLPEIGRDNNTWGEKNNANWEGVAVAVNAASAALADLDSTTADNIATPGSETRTALSAQIAQTKVWAKNPDQLVAGNLTYSGDLLTSAVVEWPDGKPGVLTITSRQPGTSAVTGYTVTRVLDGSTTLTYTQPTITRDSSGKATTVPQITVA